MADDASTFIVNLPFLAGQTTCLTRGAFRSGSPLRYNQTGGSLFFGQQTDHRI